MKWFFAFNQSSAVWFEEMIKVAVVSAIENTSLMPHCLYEGANSDLTDWLLRKGVTLIKDRVPFYEKLFSEHVILHNSGSHYSPEHASGTFLKIQSCNRVVDEDILVTDCDVMFLSDPVKILRKPAPGFSAASEVGLTSGGWYYDSSGFNAGVMYFSSKYLRGFYPRFLQIVDESNYYFKEVGSYEQVAVNKLFFENWSKLPPEMNWRPFQGNNGDVCILHFHGPKPHRIKAILKGEALSEEGGLIHYLNVGRDSYKRYIDVFYSFLSRS